MLLDSETIFAEVLRRDGDRWITEIVQGDQATLSLESVPVRVSMAEFVHGISDTGACGRAYTSWITRYRNRPRMLNRLYARILEIAAGPNALWALLAVSFAESSFFAIPPDILLIPMILAQPRRAWRYATLCMVASVLGGLLGYAIGLFPVRRDRTADPRILPCDGPLRRAQGRV